jgi:hypothetical protein
MSRSPLYKRWFKMLTRVENPKHKKYADYGGRGIKICTEWHDFMVFMTWAVASGFEASLEIDRKDTNGDYCPENCRWVTRVQNANNTRLLSTTNTSGYRGVSYTKNTRNYRCVIGSSLIPYFSKAGFKTAQEAAIARDLHVIRHGGHLNHQIPLNFSELAFQGPL